MINGDLWNNCLHFIKTKIPNQAYQTWFDGISATQPHENEIMLQVPNQFHYEWLESKYRHLIDEVITEIGDHPRVVNYSVMISNKQIDEIPKLEENHKASTPHFEKNKH